MVTIYNIFEFPKTTKFQNSKTQKLRKEFGKPQNVTVWEKISKMAKLYLLENSKMHRTLSLSMSRRSSRIMSETKKITQHKDCIIVSQEQKESAIYVHTKEKARRTRRVHSHSGCW